MSLNPCPCPWVRSEANTTTNTITNKYVYMALSFTIGLVTFLLYIFVWYLCTRHRRRRPAHPLSQPTSTGLSKAALAAIPIAAYSAPDKDSTLDCAVCITQFQRGDSVRQLPKCNHLFHVDCIDMWLYSHSTCPICRCQLPDKDKDTATTKSDSSRVAAIPLSSAPPLLLPPV